MSKLSLLQGKGKVFMIGELELELKPLMLDDLELFNVDEKASAEEQMKVAKAMIAKTLKVSVPDATDEEINSIGLNYMTELMEAVTEVNGLKEGRRVSIKDVVKAGQVKS